MAKTVAEKTRARGRMEKVLAGLEAGHNGKSSRAKNRSGILAAVVDFEVHPRAGAALTHFSRSQVRRRTTEFQSPRAGWRKRRMVGYQGVSSRSRPQRQS